MLVREEPCIRLGLGGVMIGQIHHLSMQGVTRWRYYLCRITLDTCFCLSRFTNGQVCGRGKTIKPFDFINGFDVTRWEKVSSVHPLSAVSLCC